MNRRIALLLLLLPVAGLLILVFLLWRGVSLGFAVPVLESRLSALLDRAVTIGAPPHLRVGERVYLQLGNVEIANAPWASDAPLLRVSNASAVIELASVLRGPLIVHQLRVDGLSLALERNVEGASNLPDFATASEDKVEDDAAAQTLPVILRAAELRNIIVTRHNHANDQRLSWRSELIKQSSDVTAGLLISATGTLQEKPWSLNARATALQSVAWDAPFSGEVRAEVAGMILTGNADLPALASAADLNLTLDAQGRLPPAIAALSPLLTADTPLEIELEARDIDLGIALDAHVRFPNLQVSVSGEVNQPIEGDGVELDISADANDIRKLTDALGLGETAHMPVALRGHIRRTGDDIQANAVELTIGEHRIAADIDFPKFPLSDGASVRVKASGPDFGFYQRLLKRPISFPDPYSFSGVLQAGAGGAELVTSEFFVGNHVLQLQGPLGDFPRFHGSDLRFTLEGMDIDDLGDAFAVSLPSHRYRVEGQVQVDQQGKIRIPALTAATAKLELALDGSLNGYPEFDDINLEATLNAHSLAATGRAFGLEKDLGDIPAQLEVTVSGSPQSLRATNIDLQSGDFKLTSQDGALRFDSGEITSDIELALTLSNPNLLLGDYGDRAMPDGPLYATVIPTVSSEFIDLELRRLDGQSVIGSGQLRVPRDFVIDKRAYFNADLRVDEPANLLPEMEAYAPPQEPIELQVRTQRIESSVELHAQLQAGADTQLRLVARAPVTGPGRREVIISGSGTDLRALGTHPSFPQGALPFSIDARATLDAGIVTFVAEEIDVVGSRLLGSGSYNSRERVLLADLQIPEAQLGRWLQRADAAPDDPAPIDPDDANKSPGKAQSDRVIPDYPLPLEWMERYQTDVRLETGDLGLSDPLAPEESLIQALVLHLRSSNGTAQLDMDTLAGSRGYGTGQVTMQANDPQAQVGVTVALKDIPGGLRLADRIAEELPRFTLDAQLSAHGMGTRDLAASLTGPILINGTSGVLNNVNPGWATGSFFNQLLTTLLPTVKKDSDLQVICAVIAARAEEGILHLDPGFVLRSSNADLSARGEIDLRTEKIRIRFDNQARKGLGISAAGVVNPYFQITGTLAKPALGLDVAGGAIAGGAAAATGGLSVVATAFYGRFLKRGNPCEKALKLWEEPQ